MSRPWTRPARGHVSPARGAPSAPKSELGLLHRYAVTMIRTELIEFRLDKGSWAQIGNWPKEEEVTKKKKKEKEGSRACV